MLGVRVPSLRKSHPKDEDELEGVVEWEPVDGIDGGLNDSQEGVGHPVLSLPSSAYAIHTPFRSER